MKYTLLCLAAANYFSFFCSILGIFRNDQEKQTFLFRLLSANNVALRIAGPFLIWNSVPHDGYWLIIGIQCLCLVGFWITSAIARKNRFTAVYSKDTPVTLVRTGPYKYVRHPFYVIYMCCYLSIAFTSFSVIYSALVVSIVFIYIHAARTEEAKFLASDLSGQYKSYQSQTGMFFPKL